MAADEAGTKSLKQVTQERRKPMAQDFSLSQLRARNSFVSGRCRTGFILLVVIGILAVLLTVCVGFLSYTRGEVMAVQAQRNKTDCSDVFHSAVDWTLANICKDLMDAGGMDQNKPCKYTVDPSNTGHWWMRPYEMHLISKWPGRFPNGFLNDAWGFPTGNTKAINEKSEAPWVYLPADYFPGGGVRGRFTVQVLDCNAFMNINDWNDDCMPSQCQMSHMMSDAYGGIQLENFRYLRDTADGRTPPWPWAPLRYQDAWRVVTHTSRYLNWVSWEQNPVDNQASYNWVTKNTAWLSLFGAQYDGINPILPSDGLFVCRGPAGSDPQPYRGSLFYSPIDPPDDSFTGGASGSVRLMNLTTPAGLPGNPFNAGGRYGGNGQSAGQIPWELNGFNTQAYTDPDTGRCPINVNTCYNSGEPLPMFFYSYWEGPSWAPVRDPANSGAGGTFSGCNTMEAVWNVESLRRIIKVGWFWNQYRGDGMGNTIPGWSHGQIDWAYNFGEAPGSYRSKMLVEQLKMKLAHQYQETLCRYFTGTYHHWYYQSKHKQIFPPAVYPQYTNGYPAVPSEIAPYNVAYPLAPAPLPTNYCKVTDYSAPRFPVALKDFRKNCHDDFLAMCTNVRNPSFATIGTPPTLKITIHPTLDGAVAVNNSPVPLFELPYPPEMYSPGKAHDLNSFPGDIPCDQSDASATTDGCVSFDWQLDNNGLGTPEIAPGKLDLRTAAACYDNMVPGKPVDAKDFHGFVPYAQGDPIWELYAIQLARQEDVDDIYNIDFTNPYDDRVPVKPVKPLNKGVAGPPSGPDTRKALPAGGDPLPVNCFYNLIPGAQGLLVGASASPPLNFTHATGQANPFDYPNSATQGLAIPCVQWGTQTVNYPYTYSGGHPAVPGPGSSIALLGTGPTPYGPRSLTGSTLEHNLYGYWADNMLLGAATRWGYNGGSPYGPTPGVTFPEPSTEVDARDHNGNSMSLFAKGHDIAALMDDPLADPANEADANNKYQANGFPGTAAPNAHGGYSTKVTGLGAGVGTGIAAPAPAAAPVVIAKISGNPVVPPVAFVLPDGVTGYGWDAKPREPFDAANNQCSVCDQYGNLRPSPWSCLSYYGGGSKKKGLPGLPNTANFYTDTCPTSPTFNQPLLQPEITNPAIRNLGVYHAPTGPWTQSSIPLPLPPAPAFVPPSSGVGFKDSLGALYTKPLAAPQTYQKSANILPTSATDGWQYVPPGALTGIGGTIAPIKNIDPLVNLSCDTAQVGAIFAADRAKMTGDLYNNQVSHVPWRQRCFTPDSFSTELTTTSTTFMLIINAQLVDGQTVTANPANPELHTDQGWSQYGVVIEIAPDVLAEDSAKNTIDNIAGDPIKDQLTTAGNPVTGPPHKFPSNPKDWNLSIPDESQFWHWYANEMPRKTKTYQGWNPSAGKDARFDVNWQDDSWLDDLCPSLVSLHWADDGSNTTVPQSYITPFGRLKSITIAPAMPWRDTTSGGKGTGWSPGLNGKKAETENSTATLMPDWKKSLKPSEVTTGCDIHMVPPAAVPSGRGADVIYTPANQIKKRIIIRNIWNLNQGIEK
jgi:hypothetical protein